MLPLLVLLLLSSSPCMLAKGHLMHRWNLRAQHCQKPYSTKSCKFCSAERRLECLLWGNSASKSCDGILPHICIWHQKTNKQTKTTPYTNPKKPVQKGHNIIIAPITTLPLPVMGQRLMGAFLTKGQGPCFNPFPTLFWLENAGWREQLRGQECQSTGNNRLVGRQQGKQPQLQLFRQIPYVEVLRISCKTRLFWMCLTMPF